MRKGVLDVIANEALGYGFHKVAEPNSDRPHVLKWAIDCGCGRRAAFGWGPDTSPESMVANMRRKGWEVRHGHTPVCAECRARRKDMQPKKQEAPTVVPLQIDPKIARKIYAALEDVFDDSARLYRGGSSDETVASSLDCSPQIVARIRRDAYGELAEDPQFQRLRDDLELARMQAAEDMNELQGKIQKMFREIADRIPKAPQR